jgi:CRISPR-associated protein Cmr3
MLLEPVDTLFFRDGTPFSAGSASQDDVGGLFPPHPTTVVGALRASLARRNGWSGRGRWPRELDEILGDGPDDLGRISLDGPFVVHDNEPIFRAPRHLLGSTEAGRWRPRVILRPGAAVACDLGGGVRLPEAPQTEHAVEELKPGDGLWLTRTGMNTMLRGQLPAEDEVMSTSQLWSEERRIGLQRDRGTRTAREGMLYSTRHVRMRPGVALGVCVHGLPEGWELPYGEVIALGGESRMVECRPWDVDLNLGAPLSALEGDGKVVVIALTPLDLAPQVCVGQVPVAAPGDVRVISACLGRPQRIGGWDSLARRPLPLRSILPAGSVLFCKIDNPLRFCDALAGITGLPRVGARQRWGFGVVALGAWPDESEVTS